MKIKDVSIGSGEGVFIIAEVGINHGGDLRVCEEMIRTAAEAGADAVKLQIVDADEAYARNTVSHAEFSRVALKYEELEALMSCAENHNIILFSTPGDFRSLDVMVQLGMPAIKISSGLLSNIPLIERAAHTGLPIILSSGMALESEIDAALSLVVKLGVNDVALLHCTSLYPLSDHDVNFNMMKTKATTFDVEIGFSDHTVDELACIASVAAGATIIEKHFTLDSSWSGADHHISMTPGPFASMVKKIRRVSSMLGVAHIGPTSEEAKLRANRLRCTVARLPVKKGDILSTDNLALKRTLAHGRGIEPSDFNKVIGKVAASDKNIDDPITWQDVADNGS